MSTTETAWQGRVRGVLESYDVSLLRQVAENLCRPRNQWPTAELVDRCLATLDNAATLDRRLKDLDVDSRRLLGLIARSRQPAWRIGNLLELLFALGNPSGAESLLALLNAGLLYPLGNAKTKPRIKKFDESWLNQGSPSAQVVFAPPLVCSRALGFELGLPPCPAATDFTEATQPIHEADGLQWPLRLAAVWQQVRMNPLRRTQQGDFFKRDLDRLRSDPLLAGPGADSLTDLPDPALLAVAWGASAGILEDQDGELHASAFPDTWKEELPATLASLWSTLLDVEHWNPGEGWSISDAPGNPYPSAFLLSLILLGNLSSDGWADVDAVAKWVAEHHPYWSAARSILPLRGKDRKPSAAHAAISTFLLGVAYPLRLLQALKHKDEGWLIRLSPLGRWLFDLGELPRGNAAYPQTLLVQPNLEVLVYRQGLTPELISRVSGFATWKTIGPACTAQLDAGTVYQALEAGETFGSIIEILNRHGMKPVPASVVESLRTWANKRERVSVYPSAALFEFTSAEQLNEALARGLPAARVGENLAVVTNEASIDYRHFRLIATRDYTLPPEKCVDIEADGVTLSVDVGKSDLLLETEVQRFAETVWQPTANGKRFFRLTPASLDAARQSGLDVIGLETWFAQRSHQPLSPAARLLLTATTIPAPDLRRHLVLHVVDEQIADGLQQWPGTRALIEGRLGPTALLVSEERAAELMRRLEQLGVAVQVAD